MAWKWTLDGIAVPDIGSLFWSDEVWDATVAETTDLLYGAPLVELWTRSGGRPLTLTGHGPRSTTGIVGPDTRAALRALLTPPERVMALTSPDGVTRAVIWRRSNGADSPLQFEAHRHAVGAAAALARWVPTLNLMET